jgi:hypothetical protein
MAMVPKYTNRASVPGSTGMQGIPLSLATSPLSNVGEGLTNVAGALDAAATRIQNREDIISSAVSNDQFEQETLKDYNATIESGNVLDPKLNTIGNFNAGVEQRIMKTVNSFGGSANAKAQLEATLRARAGQYANQMIKYQNTEQRKFITGKAQSEIATIAAEVAKNPAMLRSSFDKADNIVNQYAGALDPDSERKLRDAGRSAVMEQGVAGLLNRGAWQDARALLLDNPVLGRYLDQSKKDQFDKQIANFAQVENKTRVEMAAREATVTRLIASGIKIDPLKAMNYVVGADISPSAGPGEKVTTSLDALGIKPEDATTAQRAAILGIAWPKLDPPDPNKDFKLVNGPAGQKSTLTEQGAFKRTQPYIKSAVDIATKVGTVENAYKGYLAGNELEGLTVLQTYLKMIDEGAVVRDSDIALAERASPIYQTIKATVSRYGTAGAQAITRTVVDQSLKASQSFGQKALEMSKGFFDGYVQETGYGNGVLGLPGDRYDVLFKGIRTVPVRTPAAPAAAPVPAGAPEYVRDPITGKVVRKQ